MRFSDQDIKPNARIPLDQVRVGSTSDARWRAVRDSTTRVDASVAHECVMADASYTFPLVTEGPQLLIR